MLENADAPIELFHGYTYLGQRCCAAALATLDIYKEEGLFDMQVNKHPNRKGSPFIKGHINY